MNPPRLFPDIIHHDLPHQGLQHLLLRLSVQRVLQVGVHGAGVREGKRDAYVKAVVNYRLAAQKRALTLLFGNSNRNEFIIQSFRDEISRSGDKGQLLPSSLPLGRRSPDAAIIHGTIIVSFTIRYSTVIFRSSIYQPGYTAE
jgi:hypothetical protein